MIKNYVKHFILITKHRNKVFKLCIKAGIPFRGLLHDLSKYSWVEFSEGAKYFNGEHSPIANCKKEKGYSKAWIHHTRRNKHHHEYWYDYSSPSPNPIIPYKYTVEMLCDTLAAGMTYMKKNWTLDYQLTYFEKDRPKRQINDKIAAFLLEAYKEVSVKGIDKVLNPKTLKEMYKRNVGV